MSQQQPRQPAPPCPAVGAVENGYRFRGGDCAQESSWEQVEPIDVSDQYGAGARQLPNGVIERVGPRGGVERIGSATGADGQASALVGADARARFMINAGPLESAQRTLNQMDADGYRVGRDDWGAVLAESIPFDGGALARLVGGDDYTSFQQANKTYEAALLPIMSGAAVTPSEAERLIRANLPQIGDTDEVRRRKSAQRDQQVNAVFEGIGMDGPFDTRPIVGPTTDNGLPSYPRIEALTANAQEFPIPERQAAPVVDLQTASRDEIIAALRAGGTFRDGSDGQPYSLPPQEPQFGPAQEGDRMAQPGVAVRPQPGFMATPMAGPIRGAMEFARNIPAFAQSFTERVPFADEAAAALVGLTSGRGYDEVRSLQERLAQQDREERPLARNLGGIAGAIAPAAIPAATGAQWVANAPNLGYQVTRGIAAGIPVGALYGAADAEGGLQERAGAAVQGGIAGGIAGGALPVAGRVAERALNGARGLLGNRALQSPDAQTLTDAGVFVTPGAQAGGMLRSVENLAQRAPILGPAIAGARGRSVDSLNRGVANTVLSRIEQGLPAEVQPGAEAVDFVARSLGAEFDRAAAAIPTTQADDAFMQGIANVAQREVDLPESARAQFRSIIKDRLTRLNGQVTGRQLRAIESELGQVASQVQDRQLADMLLSVQDEVQGLMERASPEAAAILNRVRPAYREFVVMRRASQAAGGNPFSPSQLLTAVRGEDSSVGNSLTARGQAPLQDLARAARNVIPDQYGNPGTADAVGLGALGVTAITNPAAGIGAAAGLGAAALPYMAMGRRIVESLPDRPSEQQVTAALNQLEQLSAVEPGIRQVQQELMDRLRIGFATTAAATAGQAPAN